MEPIAASCPPPGSLIELGFHNDKDRDLIKDRARVLRRLREELDGLLD